MFGNKKENPQETEKVVNFKKIPKPNQHSFHKNAKLLIFIIFIVLFLLVLAVFGSVILGGSQRPVDEVPSEESEEQIVGVINEGLPEENTLYFGNYREEEVIFIKNVLGFSYVSDDPYFGYTYYATGSAQVKSFKDIENPIKLIDFEESVKGDLFSLNKNKSKLYINISKVGDRQGEYPNIDNFLYVIDLETFENNIIWQNSLGSGKYEEGNGTAYVKEVIDDRYVVLDVLTCYGCVPESGGNIILNTQTREEKYIKDGVFLDANPAGGTFRYEYIEITDERCSRGEENCVDGKKTMNVTSSENLP